jgi:peptidoglycan/LPS O-acetylase OafA/YrhL
VIKRVDESEQKRRFPSFDGIRGVALVAVLVDHLAINAPSGSQIGALVPYFEGLPALRVFFVMSGFLITTLLMRESEQIGHISLSRFYSRRFIRLFPVQVAYIACLFFLTKTTNLHISACRFVTSIMYVKNYACAGLIDEHLWSLSVEEQFYLLWPAVLTFLPKKHALRVAYAFILVSPFSRAYEYRFDNYPGVNASFWWWLTSNSDQLMIGCLIALQFSADWMRKLVEYQPAWGRIAALGLMIFPAVLTNYRLLGIITVTIGPSLQAVGAIYVMMSCVIVKRGILYSIPNMPICVRLGKMSYSIYIWQQLFIFGRPSDFGFARFVIFEFPLNIGLAFFAGIMSYYCIEKPLMNARRFLPSVCAKTIIGRDGRVLQ